MHPKRATSPARRAKPAKTTSATQKPASRPASGARSRTRAPASEGVSAGPASLSPSPPSLSEKQRRHLRGLAHPLKPVILLGGAGLTEGVVKETDRALHDHELIKVKAPGGGDRDARDAVFGQLAERTSSALIHRIGNVAVLYRPRPDLKRILIPDT